MDFGLARAPGQLQITLAKTLVGSIYYASPEQVWGQLLNNRSDIYALGVVLYKMVSNVPLPGVPFRTDPGYCLKHITAAHYINPDISKELEQIILTAMARNRDERYEHAAFMAPGLRTLNLRPSLVTAIRDPNFPSAANQRGSAESRAKRPPKRPQVQRPRYLDLEATQPPPGEDREYSAGEPALEQSTHQSRTANIDYEVEVPTKPLGPMIDMDELTQQQGELAQLPTNRNPDTRRTLWRQLQRIFKSSAT